GFGLLIPAQAQAWFRRRRSEPCCPEPCCPDVFAGAGADDQFRKSLRGSGSFGDINILSPAKAVPPNLPQVSGNGYFFVWGTMTNNVTGLAASVIWTGLTTAINGTAVTLPNTFKDTHWAFWFNLSSPPGTGIPVTLTVGGMLSGNG